MPLGAGALAGNALGLDRAALAESLQISRNTLREAFRVLTREGLLKHEPNRGVSVAVQVMPWSSTTSIVWTSVAVTRSREISTSAIDVTASVGGGRVQIAVRDYGQWRERVPSMDRGRGSTLSPW